jgi:hypothetical protein
MPENLNPDSNQVLTVETKAVQEPEMAPAIQSFIQQQKVTEGTPALAINFTVTPKSGGGVVNGQELMGKVIEVAASMGADLKDLTIRMTSKK